MATYSVTHTENGITVTASCSYTVTRSNGRITVAVTNIRGTCSSNVYSLSLSSSLHTKTGIVEGSSKSASSASSVTSSNYTKTLVEDDEKYVNIYLYVAAYKTSSSYSADCTASDSKELWRQTYTVTYNANGGTGAPAAQTEEYGTAIYLSSDKPTRTNYRFYCWNTAQDRSGTDYSPGRVYLKYESVTLYAIWTAIVSYDANGGTGAPASQSKYYGSTLVLTTDQPTRTGYTFKEWNTKSDGTGISYSSGSSYTSNDAVTLYAIWNATVSYNANGGSNAPASQVKEFGTILLLSDAVPTRAGYEFWHWNTASDNSGTSYDVSGAYSAEVTATLYAIWNPIVSYDANGGTGAPWPQTKTYGTTLALTTDQPTRQGYSFYRWNTKADGTGTSYQGGANYTANVAVTLYAIWRREPAAPSITSMSVVRCDSSGDADDGGTYCKVTVAWAVDTTSDTVSGNTGTVTGTVEEDGSYSPRSFSWQSGASGTGGTAVAVVSGIDTDHQYLVTVTVTDRVTSTSRSDVCTRAFFIFDFAAGGHGVGLGSAAPQDGFEVGYDAQFQRDLTVLGDQSISGALDVVGAITAPNLTIVDSSASVFSAASGWALVSQAAHTYGPLCMVALTLRPTSAKAAGSSSALGTLGEGFRPRSSCGFADAHGVGLADSLGDVTYTTVAALATTDVVAVGLTFIR